MNGCCMVGGARVVRFGVLVGLWLVLVVASCRGKSSDGDLPVLGPVRGGEPHRVRDFVLLTQDSQSFRFSWYSDRIFVVSFFFTRCPGICPRLSGNMRRLRERLGVADSSVLLVSITVDPQYDRPFRLKRYWEAYGGLPGWVFLTGPPAVIETLVLRDFFLPLQWDSVPARLVHSEKFVLLDGERHIRGYYNGLDSVEVLTKLVRDIELLRREMRSDA